MFNLKQIINIPSREDLFIPLIQDHKVDFGIQQNLDISDTLPPKNFSFIKFNCFIITKSVRIKLKSNFKIL